MPSSPLHSTGQDSLTGCGISAVERHGNIMQQAITLHYPVVTAQHASPPVPAICPTCRQVQRQDEQPIETTWRGALVMLVPLAASVAAFVATAAWVAASGVLAWL